MKIMAWRVAILPRVVFPFPSSPLSLITDPKPTRLGLLTTSVRSHALPKSPSYQE